MKRVLVGTSLNPFAAGDMAILTSTMKMLRSSIPDASFTVLVYSSPEIMQERYGDFLKAHCIGVITAPWCNKEGKPSLISKGYFCLRSLLLVLFKRGFLYDYNLYLEVGTDQHTTESLGYGHFYASLYPLLLCILCRKPFIVCAASIGPFKTKLSRLVAKFIFGRASLLTVREKISMDFLRELGISQNLYLTADPAFLLEPAVPERIDEILAAENIDKTGQPFVGMSPSSFIYSVGFPNIKGPLEKRKIYIELMARIADHIVESMDAIIIFIPRITKDLPIIQEIHQEMKQKHMAKPVGDRYTADEQAGIIGRCQLFIGCRMHSAVASVSLGVPTIALSYSHKFPGVLAPFLNEKHVISIRTHSTPDEFFGQICQQIDYLWQHREEISQELKEKMPEVTEKAWLNAELVKQLLDT